MTCLDDILRMYRCVTGKHLWPNAEDAAKCCDGYVSALRTMRDERHMGGPIISKYVLVPVEDLRSLEAFSSTGDENPWLSVDM